MHRSLLQLIAFFCFYFFHESAGQCTGTINGYTYDLSSLANPTTDYSLDLNNGQNVALIRLNMCRPLVNLGQPACAAGAAGCQLWDMPTPKYKATLGLASTMQVVPYTLDHSKRGWTAQFSGGTAWNGQPVQMEIYFICDPSVSGTGSPVIISSSKNDWQFQWNTPLGCTAPKYGGAGGLGGGGIFLIILVVLAVLYVGIGFIVNKFVRHHTGIEVLPHVAFWSGFFGLVKDGGRFIALKTCKRGGYTQV